MCTMYCVYRNFVVLNFHVIKVMMLFFIMFEGLNFVYTFCIVYTDVYRAHRDVSLGASQFTRSIGTHHHQCWGNALLV